MTQETTRRPDLNLTQVRADATAGRSRYCEPGTDPLAHRLACHAGDLADEVERLRAGLADIADRAYRFGHAGDRAATQDLLLDIQTRARRTLGTEG